MRALVVRDGKLQLQNNYNRPKPHPGEALVKIILAGICSTDLEIIKGYMGFEGVPGHEFVGIVEEAENKKLIGKRVVGTINAACGECEMCRAGLDGHCPTRTVLGIYRRDGVFAEYTVLPAVNLLEVPDGVADEEAVFCEPLAAAIQILEQVKVRPSAQVAVVGPGRLGLLIGQVLADTGCNVTMLGRTASSLKLAEEFGLQCSLVSEAKDDSYDLVVEATGNPEGFAHSLRIVRPRGTMVLKSTFATKSELDLTKIVVAEITVVGSRCGPFAPALDLLSQDRVWVREMIAKEFRLQDGLEAMEYATSPGVKKVLVRP